MRIGRSWNWTHQWWYSYLLIWSRMDAAARSLNEEAYTHKEVDLRPPSQTRLSAQRLSSAPCDSPRCRGSASHGYEF
ncbi:hypothetical protein CPB84DRAFT_1785764, partial [Gymnopilus junonius]